jgi:diguanylate cyclase (GGDEF)-like protein
LKTLIVEDDAGTRLVLAQTLKKRGYPVTVSGSAEDAMHILKHEFHPLIILDLYLPGMDGAGFCRWARERPEGSRYYILVGTSSTDSHDLEKILEAGANDYVQKPYQQGLFMVRLSIAEQQVKVLAQRKDMEDKLAYLVTRDPLTHVYNHSQLDPCIQTALQDAQGGKISSLLFIDIDNFKTINDTLGHAAGDRLLIHVASLLRQATREQDSIIRFGGDEFAVVLNGISLEQAKPIAERIRMQIDALAQEKLEKKCSVSASVGLALVDGMFTAPQVLAHADSACYTAKSRGRNRVETYGVSESEFQQKAATVQTFYAGQS